ncbi:hypothetical protein [Actinoplanes sp. HUAS TT8]|uniref:hypothetical protein n=1 Tax=Actinoplanes sp. HUAS TT8 TaxID=3447453 RepID=UPI003F525FBE
MNRWTKGAAVPVLSNEGDGLGKADDNKGDGEDDDEGIGDEEREPVTATKGAVT